MTKVIMHGINYDANSSFMFGASDGPIAIRNAFFSKSANMGTEAGFDLSNDLWCDVGNLAITNLSSEQAYTAILENTVDLLNKHDKILTLGGDHSIAYPVIEAHSINYSKINVLHIDAHGDIYDNFQGNPYSHASPFARLLERGIIGRLVQVGIRTLTEHQRQQCARFGVETYEMQNYATIPNLSFENSLGEKAPFYISLDLDAMDPAFCPGVSHHEPGGLTTREVLNLIHRTKGILIGAEIVELNPLQDINKMTAMVGAKLAKELLARLIND